MTVTLSNTALRGTTLQGLSGAWSRTDAILCNAGDVVIHSALVRIRSSNSAPYAPITTTLTGDGTLLGAVQTRESRDGTEATPTTRWFIAAGIWVKTAATTGNLSFSIGGTITGGPVPNPVGPVQSSVQETFYAYGNADTPTGLSVVEYARGYNTAWTPGEFRTPSQVTLAGTKPIVATANDGYGFPDAPTQVEFIRTDMTRFVGTVGTRSLGTWNTNPLGLDAINRWRFTNDAKLAFVIPLKAERRSGLYIGAPLGPAGFISAG